MQTNYLKYFVGLLLVSVLVGPTYIYLSVSPQFTNLIIENTEKEADRIANHLVSMLALEDKIRVNTETLIMMLSERDKKIREDFHIEKIKFFLPSGEILFSSDGKDVGTVNRKSYFREIVVQGEKYTKLVKKDHETAEGRFVKVDVVEIYVPVVSQAKVVGAFEIYYDITESLGRLDKLLMHIYFVLAFFSGILLLAVFILFDRASKSETEKRKADREKEKLINELQGALQEIKALQGIIPICSFCKQIRDDEGYWQQVDHYIGEHSEAKFSHSVCPKCMEEQYPDFSSEDE